MLCFFFGIQNFIIHVRNLFSVLASLLFASFSTKTSVKKKTVLSDRGKAIENRYAFSTNAMKRRPKESSSLCSSGAFESFFFCFFTRRSTWITLKYFVRRDEKRKKAIKKTQKRRIEDKMVKWKWMSFMFPSCVVPCFALRFPRPSRWERRCFAWHRACRFGVIIALWSKVSN